VEYENNDKKMESVFSSKIRAGKRRTYFFDVRATKGNDYFLTITESRKRFDDNGYDRHKIFLYKEDFNKFLKALTESLDYVKTELMPDFDFDAFNHEYDPAFVPDENQASTVPPVFETPSSTEVKSNEVIETKEVEAPNATETTPIITASSGDNLSTEEVDKW
jgi:Protein of unknown function (DUF3276)